MLNKRSIAVTRGFTMIELIIGMAIMAILMALAAPNFSTWIQNSRIRGVAESIVNGLQLARSEAVMRNAEVEFTFTSGSGWRIGCRIVTATCPESIQSRAEGEGATGAITVDALDGTPIRFDSLGRLDVAALAAGATSARINIDSSALPAAQSRDLRVTVTVAGGVRMCDPNVSDATDSRFC